MGSTRFSDSLEFTGGIITIKEDWDFSLYVHDEGIWNELESGEYEIEMVSSNRINGDHVVDPLFWIVAKFDEGHEKVVSAKATGYKSEWPGGWMEIDKDNNVYDDTGVEHMEGELEERSKGIPVRAASRERDTPIIKRGHQALFLYRCSIH